MADLKTTYKDDVLDTSKNTKRKYNMIQNSDGTVSLDDVTEYTQQGDDFGSADINATNTRVNEIDNGLTASDGTHFRFGKDEDGKYGYIITDETGADTVIPFNTKKRIVNLGEFNSKSSHTIFLTDYKGYQNFTIDDFILINCKLLYENIYSNVDTSQNIIGSYDQKTGTLILNASTTWTGNPYIFYMVYSVGLLV